MKRFTLCLLLSAGILLTSFPLSAQQTNVTPNSPPTVEQLTPIFEDELTAYAVTHTDDEVRQYAQNRLNEMTASALGVAVNELPTVQQDLITIDPYPYYPGDPGDPWGIGGDERYNICITGKTEACRRNYNADIFTSAVVASGIMAACMAISGGAAAIACAALALAAHAAGIAAANERYQGCVQNAMTDCYLQYPPSTPLPRPPRR
ncbi:MAG TPA: hypothetical protein VI306_10350 [Pyrinomonadaceae bacterium]